MMSIGLLDRDIEDGDNHALFVFLKKDGSGNLIIETDLGAYSSYWLEDCIKLMHEADEWLKKNAIPARDKGKQWGWDFDDKRRQVGTVIIL